MFGYYLIHKMKRKVRGSIHFFFQSWTKHKAYSVHVGWACMIFKLPVFGIYKQALTLWMRYLVAFYSCGKNLNHGGVLKHTDYKLCLWTSFLAKRPKGIQTYFPVFLLMQIQSDFAQNTQMRENCIISLLRKRHRGCSGGEWLLKY